MGEFSDNVPDLQARVSKMEEPQPWTSFRPLFWVIIMFLLGALYLIYSFI